jgi:hypothetical protein
MNAFSPALVHQVRKRISKTCWDNWNYRTRVVIASPDNEHIRRVPNAGQIDGSFQVMHNGLRVVLGSYYGEDLSELLRKNRGVHEPQEERVFQEVLPCLPQGSAMIELGAYWAFYSMWFCKEVPDARAYLVEPDPVNLEFGRRNFAANDLVNAEFTQASVGSKTGTQADGSKVVCVDDFVSDHKIDQVAILHSDIQGFEVEMLEGARATLSAGKVAFCFISTHGVELHRECETQLRRFGFDVLASIAPPESYSIDGLIVARWPTAPKISAINLSRKPLDL